MYCVKQFEERHEPVVGSGGGGGPCDKNTSFWHIQSNVLYIYTHTHTYIPADDTTVMLESEEKLKSLLIRVKEESEKLDLKLNIQKTKFIASGPITSWQIDRENVKEVTDIIFLGSKVTVDSDCSHKIKRHLSLE